MISGIFPISVIKPKYRVIPSGQVVEPSRSRATALDLLGSAVFYYQDEMCNNLFYQSHLTSNRFITGRQFIKVNSA